MQIVVVGCGRMGSGVARTLQVRKHGVTVVDKDPAALVALGEQFAGHTVTGNALDQDLLLRAGINRADGLASVTDSDEINLVVARLARQIFHVPKVIARVVEPRKAAIYERLGVHTIATTTWGVNRITNLLSHGNLAVQATIGGEVELVTAEIAPRLAGRTLFNLTIPGEATVVAITRGGHTFLPATGTAFEAGDLVHLAVMAASADRVKQLLG